MSSRVDEGQGVEVVLEKFRAGDQDVFGDYDAATERDATRGGQETEPWLSKR